jgi:hypothetical protein
LLVPKIKIEGRSGCNLEIIQNSNQYLIRKSSSSLEYNSRIQKQCKKQNEFYINAKFENILTPKILFSGINNRTGFSYFEMQYISGEKYSDFFLHCQITEVTELIELLIFFIDTALDHSEFVFLPSDTLLNKIGSLRSLIEIQGKASPSINKVFEFLETEIPNVIIPMGICHGDLTLSNIIFSNKNLYLIDFLDSFIESPLIDIVKLRQDTKFYWSLMIENDLPIYQKNKVIQILRFIDECLDDYFRKNEHYLNWYNYLEKLNLLRILPYLANRKEREFVNQCLNHT